MAKLTKEQFMDLRTAYFEVLSKFPDLNSEHLPEVLQGIEDFSNNLNDKLEVE